MASDVRRDLERARAEQERKRAQQKPPQRRADTRTPQQRGETWDMRLTHPPAYAIDQALGDISSVLPAEWEHKPTVPVPEDTVSRIIGEGGRGLLDLGALFLAGRGGKKIIDKFVKPKIAQQVKRDVKEHLKKKAKRKAKRDAKKIEDGAPQAKPKPAEKKPKKTLPNGPVDIRKHGGGFDTEYLDNYGRRYKPIGRGPNGRKRFKREDGVTVIEQDNGKFIPQRTAK
jgi:hypothetical protein